MPLDPPQEIKKNRKTEETITLGPVARDLTRRRPLARRIFESDIDFNTMVGAKMETTRVQKLFKDDNEIETRKQEVESKTISDSWDRQRIALFVSQQSMVAPVSDRSGSGHDFASMWVPFWQPFWYHNL